MEKIYTALGLMSGTSLDGIDASIVCSDGEKFINIEENQYYKYNDSFRERLRKFIKGCYDKDYIDKHNKVYNDLQKQLTLDHVKISKKLFLTTGQKLI